VGVLLSILLAPIPVLAELADIPPGEEITRNFGAAADRVEMQQKLKAAGVDPGKIDGIFGPATFNAIRAFRRLKGLPDQSADSSLVWDEALKHALLSPRAPSSAEQAPAEAASSQAPRAVSPIQPRASEQQPGSSAITSSSARPTAPQAPTVVAPPSLVQAVAPMSVSPPAQNMPTPRSTQNILVTTPHPDAETVKKLDELGRELHDPEVGIVSRLRRVDKAREDGDKAVLERLEALSSNLNRTMEKTESKLDNYFWIFVGSIISAALALVGAAWNYAQNIESKVEARVDKDIDKYLSKYGDLEKSMKESVTGAEETLLVQIKEMENEVDCNRRNIAEAETRFSRMKAELEVAAERALGRDAELEDLLKRVSDDFEAVKKDFAQTKLEQKHCLDNFEERLADLDAKAKESIELAKRSAEQIDGIRAAFGSG